VIRRDGAQQLVQNNFAYTAGVSATFNGQLEAVKVIHEETNIPINSRGSTGNTMLMFAALAGQYDVANYLLQNGADISIKNRKGETALNLARNAGNLDVALLLQQYGAKF
jgi:uncharacterized protein